ncbi:4-deoxy-L-threo-5-hexosulose-uronate ketol-isomerase [Caldicellulosiruptor obsidiansis OB47]|uniref:4-deoxy-L-threo-5-hexosulose-uronate ketol-isomerase n=1 Tax=Caldicellulosiruptor obsidiansis (strain ATCC BAA-2073 / JCM 16842 / OB47) TaxID=608506 RepID=D9TGZ8_CALOO|nr:5-dehydro-4-deoxy-D-glucuronate isomerase [Caldicellulosiruptor obsidiansis]ADL43395.1 4-deoxy-L-threo-5-hexosulose-uronate ketol-isomerase [Caldicellulosiruptor obsidiansis OB47]
MEVKYAMHPDQFKTLTTDEIRKEFLIENLFEYGKINMVYTHVDRVIVGGAVPTVEVLILEDGKEIGAQYFLERREIGIINIGSKGYVVADGQKFELDKRDGLYIGMGTKKIEFGSDEPANPAKFYFVSTPAHKQYPIEKIDIKNTEATHLGSLSESNERTIYKYIHPDGVKSCQLVMGMTILEPNNVWNTMPCHLHDRRMEVYFYFDMPEDAFVLHLMGKPQETRHIIVRNEQAVISPSWSIHSGVGTKNYTFIWAMAGENQSYSDVNPVPMKELK